MSVKKLFNTIGTELTNTSIITLTTAYVIAFAIDATASIVTSRNTLEQRDMLGDDGAYRLHFQDSNFQLLYRAWDSNGYTAYNVSLSRKDLTGVFYQAVTSEDGDMTLVASEAEPLLADQPDHTQKMHMACRIALQMATGDAPPPFLIDIYENNALGTRFLNDFCL